MNINITSPYGIKLLTANTRLEEDITATIDSSLLPSGELTVTENGTYDVYNKETVVVNTPQYSVYNGAYEVNKSGYTVTITASDDGGGGNVTYSTDNGLTGTVNSGDTITLNGVTSISILFNSSAPAANMTVNETYPSIMLIPEEPTTLTITQDTTLDILFMWM